MNSFQDTIFPYLLKEYLIYLIYVLGFSVLFLFIALIFHKIYTEKRAKKKKQLTDTYSSLLYTYLANNAPLSEKPKSNLQYEAFADACIGIVLRNEYDTNGKIRSLITDISAVEHFKKLAAASSWTKRFFAIETLGFFMMDDLKGFFRKKLEDEKVPEVRAKAVWALSMVADRDDLKLVTSLLSTGLSNSSKFNEYIFANLIESFKRKKAVDTLVQFIGHIKNEEDVPLLVKRDLISACGASDLKEADTIIGYYIRDFPENPMIKMSCIRALGVHGSLDHEKTMAGLSDYDWRIRTVTAKALHLSDNDIITRLQKLLYDRFYNVRINAARKLAALGGSGLSALKNEADSSDRFVKDTVRYILNEVNGHV